MASQLGDASVPATFGRLRVTLAGQDVNVEVPSAGSRLVAFTLRTTAVCGSQATLKLTPAEAHRIVRCLGGEVERGSDGGVAIRLGRLRRQSVAAGDRYAVPGLSVFGAGVSSEAVLADSMVTCQDGPTGDYMSSVLPPGKYYVLATYDSIDKSPETLAAILRAQLGHRSRRQSRTTASVTVEPRTLFDRLTPRSQTRHRRRSQ